nr:MAG TPA: Ornithine aminotransferase [Bacteriophage sp.]
MPSLPITNDISLRPACKADFYTVAQNLRPADKAELVRTHGRADGALLEHFARYSTVCGVVAARGKAVGLWGLVPDGPPSARACVWLLTARGVEKFPLGFCKAARVLIPCFLRLYPQIYNYIDARYPAAVRFARWLGARLKPARLNGADFWYGTWRKYGWSSKFGRASGVVRRRRGGKKQERTPLLPGVGAGGR